MLKRYIEINKENEKAKNSISRIEHTVIESKCIELVEGKNLIIQPIEHNIVSFKFFEQNVVICDDGEIIKGARKNFSRTYYFGKDLSSNHPKNVIEFSRLLYESKITPKGYIILHTGRLMPIQDDEDYTILNLFETWIEVSTKIFIHNKTFSSLFAF